MRINAKLKIENWELKLSGILEKWGFLSFFWVGMLVFGGKNGVWWVNLHGLGKPGKKKTFKNVRKYSKIFKNIQILSRNVRKYSKIFNKLMVTGNWLNGDWGGVARDL